MGERLKDKVALVMGAGSRPAETGTDIAPEYGNGKASAVLFGREGARVFAVDRVIEAAEETRRIIEDEGGVCMAFAADVARADEVEAATTACMDAWGRIDVLHNNVGITSISGQSDAVAETEERWDRVMDVNVKGMFLTCRAALPHMEAQGSGSIINISSIAGIRWTGVATTVYSASKAAVIGLSQQIAVQFAPQGVRCNAILPGLMDTPLIYRAQGHTAEVGGGDVRRMLEARASRVPMKRQGSAWDTAYASLFLASDESRYITGVALPVDGGITVSCAGPSPA